MRVVRIEKFGKDHWSLLGYVNCRVANGDALDPRHLRANEKTHPMHAVNFQSTGRWKGENGTRLSGYFDEGADKSKLLLRSHDDWDCLNDMEAAGLLIVISEINGFVKLTDAGQAVANQLVKHKAIGGNFASFNPMAMV